MLGAIDKIVVGTYTITYSAVDNAENKANAVTREVTIAPKTVILTTKDTSTATIPDRTTGDIVVNNVMQHLGPCHFISLSRQ